jgi:hypothetical protein
MTQSNHTQDLSSLRSVHNQQGVAPHHSYAQLTPNATPANLYWQVGAVPVVVTSISTCSTANQVLFKDAPDLLSHCMEIHSVNRFLDQLVIMFVSAPDTATFHLLLLTPIRLIKMGIKGFWEVSVTMISVSGF